MWDMGRDVVALLLVRFSLFLPYTSYTVMSQHYRRLLKSAQAVFKADTYAMMQARAQLREEFLKNKNVSSPEELKALYQGVDEVDEMLRFNIVQGRLNSSGNYEVPCFITLCLTAVYW